MKFSIALLSAVLVGAAVCAVPASLKSQEQKQDQKADTKQTKWQGNVVRIYKDSKTMDIRGGVKNGDSVMRKITYDDSTAWTHLGKPGKQEDVKEGSFIIVLGHVGKDGALLATRIDLRLPR